MEQYLKDLSQSTYNIIQIVTEHCRDPYIDKKLMSLYKIEKEKLANLLSNQSSDTNFMFDQEILFDSLISNNYDTERSKTRIEMAKDELNELLTKVQFARGGAHIVTGLEDGDLKDYLNQRKRINGSVVNSEHKIEIKEGNKLFINNAYAERTLSPKIFSLLNKLLETDGSGQYKAVKTSILKRTVISDDAFRSQLKRLREITSRFFKIVSQQTVDGQSGYKIVSLTD